MKKLKKRAKKAITHQADLNGEILTVKTACKTFGDPILEKGLCKKCIKCENHTALACFITAGHNVPKIVKSGKMGPRNSNQPWSEVFAMLAEKTPLKTIREQLEKSFNTEGSCKSFVSTASSAYKAVTSDTGTSKMFNYAQHLVTPAKEVPTIMNKSKRFVTMAHEYVQAQAN